MVSPAALTITTLSDWHIGTGAGIPGGVDRSVIRDPGGLPYMPASSLTGLVRASAKTIALALDDDALDNATPDGPWMRWFNWLFGGLSEQGERAPGPAAVKISAARLEPALRAVLVQERLTADTTILRASTAIDDATGTADDKTLRTVEYARKGARLCASIERADGNATFPPEAAFLLAAAAKATERFGGKRTRGAGRCSLSLDPAPDWKAWCRWAETHIPADPPPMANPIGRDTTAPGVSKPGWESIDLAVVVVEPVAAEAERLGNTLTTRPLIPGTVLLATAHQRLGSNLGPAIAAGELQVSDAVPLGRTGTRTTRTPAGWLIPKRPTTDETRICDTLTTQPDTDTQMQRLSSPFVDTVGREAQGIAVATSIDAHAVIDERTGRPTAASGGLFLRSAIRPGTRLGVTVRWRRGLLDKREVREALSGRWHVGTARHAGYGAVDVTVSGAPTVRSARCDMLPAAGDLIMVEARSDVLLRNGRLRWDPTPSSLAAALQVGGWTFEPAESGPGADTAAVTVARRDSWHAGWSLPRPTLCAIGAGSRMLLRCTSAGPSDALVDLVERGIGERLAEGFGEIRLSSTDDSVDVRIYTIPDDAAGGSRVDTRTTLGPHNEADQQYLASVRQAAHRKGVQLALTTAALPHVEPNKPGASQLGALRSVGVSLALAPGPGARDRARSWLGALRDTERRAEKWNAATLDHIAAFLNEPEKVWRELDLEPIEGLTLETLGWYLAAGARNGGAQ